MSLSPLEKRLYQKMVEAVAVQRNRSVNISLEDLYADGYSEDEIKNAMDNLKNTTVDDVHDA